MIRNYLTVALRNLRKNPSHTAINVFGLAIGIACCVLMMLFVKHERSFDRFHERADDLYRAWGREDWGEGRTFFYTTTQYVLAPTLEANIPEVESVTRVQDTQNLVGPEQSRYTERLHFVDDNFFDVFSFRLLRGDAATALDEPSSVVLTPDVANKYFGDADPMGQTLPIQVGDDAPEPFTVTGIVEAPPAASSIQYAMLLPFENVRARQSEEALMSWTIIGPETYVLLRDGTTAASVDASIAAMFRQILGERAEEIGIAVGLQPITDIHLNQEYPTGIEATSDPAYSTILGIVAGLVLLIAAINFVTLSIGQSTRRALEVGVRKAIGAGRGDLMRQFWGEAFLTVVLSLGVGLVFAWLLLPVFNQLSGRELGLSPEPATVGFLAFLLVGLTLGAGSYPAVFLSRFRPMEALRDRLQIAGDKSLLRRGLVVVQFALSITMIIGTLFVSRQLSYMQTADLGFDEEQVLILRTGIPPEQGFPVIERFRNAVASMPDVESVAASAYALDEGWAEAGYTDNDGAYRTFRANWGSPDYIETMDIRLAAGRGFSGDLASDSTAVVVNETFAREYGWADPQEAIGKRLPGPGFPAHEIIGVVRDFNYESLRATVSPLVLMVTPQVLFRGIEDFNASTTSNRKIAVRVRPDNIAGTVASLERVWRDVAPGLDFDYYFLDDAVDAQYRQEAQLGRIVGAGTLLSVIIACLGLFGLATLTVARRTKEIGVRKVLGASVSGLVLLLTRDFARLVAVAFVLATPLAYFAVRAWLDDYAYRVPVSWHVFAVAGVLALCVAVLTVGYHSFRAALADPVRSLRYE